MQYKLINQTKSTPIETIMENRGIKSKDIFHFLNTTFQDINSNDKLNNISDGIKMLARHIKNNDKIFIQVDEDCDGYTSSALLINYLYDLFPYYIQNNLYYRTHRQKAHGIELDTIPDDVKLVIVPDAGSNQYTEHKILYDKGIDILILDHHDATCISPYACVINNQLDNYPNKALSGVAIVYKFCNQIDKILGTDYSNKYLDLVALGLIGDMMDTREYETRYLINTGLAHPQNPYICGMMERNKFKLNDCLTPMGVAFYIAPLINAVARVGEPEERRVLLQSMINHLAFDLIPSTKRGCSGQLETIVEQACRMSANVKSRQTKIRDANVEIINQLITKRNLLNNKILVILLDKKYEVNKNLTGLIANEFANKYQRPTLILNEVIENGIKYWEGSGRGYEFFAPIKDFKAYLNSTKLFEFSEGHDNAFGARIAETNISQFLEETNEKLKEYDGQPIYLADFIYQSNNIDINTISTIPEYEYLWGQNFKEPYVVIENLKLTKDNVIYYPKETSGTLKIKLPQDLDLIKFNVSPEEYKNLYAEQGCIVVNVIGTCKINEFLGKTNPEIFITDYEIINTMPYYF